jgi:DNA-binding MarR family transcriptional regulator
MNEKPKMTLGPAFLLSQAGAHAAFRFGELLEAIGLKPHHAGILRMLGFNPGLSQQALSQILSISPSQLVVLLDFLEKRRFVQRNDSRNDRRQYSLHLTRGGETALAEIGRLTSELEDELFSWMTKAELQTLRTLLERVVAHQQITPGVHPAYKQLAERPRETQTSRSRRPRKTR